MGRGRQDRGSCTSNGGGTGNGKGRQAPPGGREGGAAGGTERRHQVAHTGRVQLPSPGVLRHPALGSPAAAPHCPCTNLAPALAWLCTAR